MFRIEWTEKAFKQLSRLPRVVAKTIYKCVGALVENPRGSNVKKLVGRPFYRLRVGDYRVIIDIKDQELVIMVLEVGHRKGIYK
ncbi:MAG: type II toxin-antitoxin system RelE/ParE family toxin [Candidatus Sigynarchaeota archaeon]